MMEGWEGKRSIMEEENQALVCLKTPNQREREGNSVEGRSRLSSRFPFDLHIPATAPLHCCLTHLTLDVAAQTHSLLT